MSAVDPKTFATTGPQSITDRIAALESKVASLSQRPQVALGDGAPTADLPDGWCYVDRTTRRLWIRVSAVWRYVGLT